MTFSLKYLVNFCKASSLSPNVTLSLSNEVPLLVEYVSETFYYCEIVLTKSRYGMEAGYVRFYLAPKIGDEE